MKGLGVSIVMKSPDDNDIERAVGNTDNEAMVFEVLKEDLISGQKGSNDICDSQKLQKFTSGVRKT